MTLEVDAPDNGNYDVTRWRFQNSPLVEINRKTKTISTLDDDRNDRRFNDKLEMDGWSGSLTIRNMRSDLAGLYEVNIESNSGTHTVHKTYTVTVSGEYIKVLQYKHTCLF